MKLKRINKRERKDFANNTNTVMNVKSTTEHYLTRNIGGADHSVRAGAATGGLGGAPPPVLPALNDGEARN